jgi:hypothetical protein
MADRPESIPEDQWNARSPAEQEALAEGPLEFEENGPSLRQAAADEEAVEPEPAEEPKAEAPEPTEAPSPEPTAAPAATPEATAAPAPEPATEEAPPAPPGYVFDENAPQVEPPPPLQVERLEERRAEHAAALAALDKKLDDGELDTAAYVREREKVRDEQTKLAGEVLKAEAREDARVTVINQRWDTVRTSFMRVPANATLYQPNTPAIQELHDTVMEIANRPSSRGWTDAKILAEADRRVRAYLGVPAKAAAPAPAATQAPAPAAQPPAAPAPARAPKLTGIPPTLSEAPPADAANVGSRFAHLDRLKGMALEKAVAALAPADRDEWLAGAN